MHPLIDQYSEYFSEGSLQARIYEIDGYPGAIESENPQDKVVGEIYKIQNSDALLAQLDEYEGCSDDYPHPTAYIRKLLPVSVNFTDLATPSFEHEVVHAWVYIYNHPVSESRHITSGDYFNPCS